MARSPRSWASTITGPRLSNPAGRPLEELIQANAHFINPATFYERLPALEGQVCWIDIPGGGGTGFLVGPDLVLTNQHVIDRVASNQARWQDVRCLFDYRPPRRRLCLGKKVTEVGLAEQWLHDSRPPSRYDWNPTLGDAGAGETDSALIRLADPVGNLPLGGMSTDPEAEPRRWIDTTVEPAPLTVGNQVFVLQHPKESPSS